jgi:tRNA A37 threonylcarbamoyladenosine biosynthesis protein TsaE
MTTSADTTKQEIVRFLKNSEPGVLCINGAWGVGKTFLWRQVLALLWQILAIDWRNWIPESDFQ